MIIIYITRTFTLVNDNRALELIIYLIKQSN